MKRNITKAVLLAAVLTAASLGGVSAYLTDFKTASNEFTVGSVEIELQEPGWNPEEHTKIEPGKEIVKDPQIKNTGTNEAFVYLEVTVPEAEVQAADQEGNRLDKEMQELFSFQAGKKWTNLKIIDEEGSRIYVYAYNEILEPGETTECLFKKIKFLNVIEGQIDGQQYTIPVRAYAIQAAYTGGEGGTITEQAAEAFEKYVNQNRGYEGQANV